MASCGTEGEYGALRRAACEYVWRLAGVGGTGGLHESEEKGRVKEHTLTFAAATRTGRLA